MMNIFVKVVVILWSWVENIETKLAVFWDVELFIILDTDRRFGATSQMSTIFMPVAVRTWNCIWDRKFEEHSKFSLKENQRENIKHCEVRKV